MRLLLTKIDRGVLNCYYKISHLGFLRNPNPTIRCPVQHRTNRATQSRQIPGQTAPHGRCCNGRLLYFQLCAKLRAKRTQ